MIKRANLPLAMLVGVMAQAAAAQDSPAPSPASAKDDDVDIVVRADRLPGQLDTDVAPIDELDAADIEAIGAGSISELLEAITPQTGSNRGRGGGGQPVILVNGVRIGSFRELGSYPPEAIQKVEVFPEEVAQQYGYSPDQRVVNIVLKPNFASREIELEYKQPGQGGFSRTEAEGTYLRIDKANRFNLNAEIDHRSSLTEGERGVIQTTGSAPTFAFDPDPADFRTLVSDFDSVELTGNYSTSVGTGGSFGLNLTYQRNENVSLAGLDTVQLTAPDGSTVLRSLNRADPLESRFSSDTLSTSGSYTRPLGEFTLTGTWNGSLAESTTEIERRADTSGLVAAAANGRLALDTPFLSTADAGFDTSQSRVWSGTSLVTLRGNPLLLPAGEVSTTFDAGYDWTRIESADTRSGTATQLTRGDLSGGLNVNVPITSRREDFGDAIGDLSFNGQAGFNRLSDFGTLYDWSAGLNWSPFENLDLQATYTWREAAPGLSQLGSPVVQTFNVPVFDLANNETVLATITSGGNPNLRAETQKDWKFSANWELPFVENMSLRAEYIRNRSNDVTQGFPLLTPAIEAAFPGRVTRANDGTLLELDRRSVTFSETRAERLSFGLFARGSVGKARPQAGGDGEGPPRGGPGASERRGPPPGESGASGGPGGDRRAQFMAFRDKICADDGEAFVLRLADALERGELPEDAPEGFDLEGAKRFLQRFEREDGTYDREQIKAFRAQFCERMAGGGERPGMSPERREQFLAFRQRLCADDGEAFLLRLVEALDKGEELPDLPEGFEPERARQLLARFRNEDGTIDRERLAQFRTGFCERDPSASGGPSQAQGPRGGGRRGGGFGRFGGGGDGRGRYFLSLTHNIELENEVLIAPGIPVLDQLAGEGLSASGTPRHTSRLEAGLFWNGWGTRLSGRYTGKAQVIGSGTPGGTDLFFGDIATFDLRIFADLGQIAKKEKGFLKNLRVSLRADNVFDARQRVVDGNGDVPLAYQPFLVDPVGRYVGIELRKVF